MGGPGGLLKVPQLEAGGGDTGLGGDPDHVANVLAHTSVPVASAIGGQVGYRVRMTLKSERML